MFLIHTRRKFESLLGQYCTNSGVYAAMKGLGCTDALRTTSHPLQKFLDAGLVSYIFQLGTKILTLRYLNVAAQACAAGFNNNNNTLQSQAERRG